MWLNWGLTEQDIDEMPTTIVKGFGSDVGPVELEDGSIIKGGLVLTRDQWTTASYTPLEEKHQPQDIWIHKNRLSGFWGATAIEDVLTCRGIRTLLFAGAKTDQCVGNSLLDACMKGWDCLLISDGCATTSPKFAKQCIEFNSEQGWGFVLSCEDLAKGVDGMQTAPSNTETKSEP